MRLSQRCLCLHEVWRGNLILTILSCENLSNIWELNYEPKMCGANKLTGKMELVLVRNEWISLFSHGTFQRYVFMLSTWFFRTSGNDFNCLIKHGATFSSLNISRNTTARVMTNILAIRYFFSQCGKLKNQFLKSIVITFCKKRLSCNRVIKRGCWQFEYTSTLLSTWLV